MGTSLTSRPTTTSPAHTVIIRRTATAAWELAPRRRRDGVIARLLHGRLDARLARGVAPESRRMLAVRAAQLVEPQNRNALADAWDGVVDRATQPRGLLDPRIPVAGHAVRAATPEIAALTAALRSATPVSAGGIARADALLTDGRSPVYYTGRSDLTTAVAHLVADLTITGGRY